VRKANRASRTKENDIVNRSSREEEEEKENNSVRNSSKINI
jgi:hypothetical protein